MSDYPMEMESILEEEGRVWFRNALDMADLGVLAKSIQLSNVAG